jgi:hypothetical protein
MVFMWGFSPLEAADVVPVRHTMKDNVELTPAQELKLRRLMSRSDALTAAYCALEDEDYENFQRKADLLVVLDETRQEAEQQFQSYKNEVGIG